MAGIYVHIPFCRQACHYCDFHFSTNLTLTEEMVQAIGAEIGIQRGYLSGEEVVRTIYFGGGTPSLLSESDLHFILEKIRSVFPVIADPEITLEANPDDLSPGKLRAFNSAGINRLSIGIQSLDDNILKSLNRAHNAAMATRCVRDAYDMGFENISVDLIYAIPQQDDGRWKKNIDGILALKPQHISSYSLTIEEKTVFGRWASQGRIIPVHDDSAATQLLYLMDVLEGEGYEQYEISNFSRPGFQSQHNRNYWRDEVYLGLGPSAHSYDRASRQYNIKNNHSYLRSIATGSIPATVEVLSREDKINEYLMTSLRTSGGCSVERLNSAFGYDLITLHGGYIHSLIQENYATLENETLLLTRGGKLLADKIASDLFTMP